MIAKSLRIHEILSLCFVVFIGIESKSSPSRFMMPGAQYRVQQIDLSQRPNIFPSNKVPSRYRFGVYGNSNGFRHNNFPSTEFFSQPNFLGYSQRYKMVNQPYLKTPPRQIYRKWSRYPLTNKPILRSHFVQPQSYSYFPLSQRKNYNQRLPWRQYPRGTRLLRNTVIRGFPAATPSATYSRQKVMYPTDRVERDSVLNLRSSNVYPMLQSQALLRNTHAEHRTDQKAFLSRGNENYYNNSEVSNIKLAKNERPKWSSGNWNKVPHAAFSPPIYTQKPNIKFSDWVTPKAFIPRPQNSAAIRRLKYVLQSLKKRNARTTLAGYTKQTKLKDTNLR